MALFNNLGAMATPMASGDVFTGLQQKTIVQAENSISDVLANKFYEVTKNITYTNICLYLWELDFQIKPGIRFLMI